jgi:pimeloyl-ACP methyl ester carboxylesterase
MHDARAELGSLRMPTLLLHGQRDVILSAESQRALLERLPNATLKEINDAGHDLVNEAPELCATLVLDFLRER